MPVTVLRSFLPVTAEEAYAWHTRAGALERLTPPWREVRVLDPGNGLAEGSRVVLTVRAAAGWRRSPRGEGIAR